MKKKILIYGAGAIGRGYLPWVFNDNIYNFYFVESNRSLCELLNLRGSYSSYMTIGQSYVEKMVKVAGCFNSGDEVSALDQFDLVATAVGPRSFMSLTPAVRNMKAPLICFENDDKLSLEMRDISGHENVSFGVPDVISSNAASPQILQDDPLAVITESGTCFVSDSLAGEVAGDLVFCDESELRKQWKAKLYIHNTPHCIAAYLGNLLGVRYVHEAMLSKSARGIVEGAMLEMAEMLRRSTDLDSGFIDYYCNKELARFSNRLLFDPVSRVAREPFRKLAPDERLLGAAQLCLSSGIVPNNLIIGILSAVFYVNDSDPDAHIGILRESLPKEDLLTLVLGLRRSDALYHCIISRWDKATAVIQEIQNELI